MLFFRDATPTIYIFYILDLIVFLFYLYKKIILRRYLFSFFNIGLYLFAFTIFIIAPFQYDNEAWLALGKSYSYDFIPYLNEVYTVNLVGFGVYILFIYYYEFIHQSQTVKKTIYNLSLNLDKNLLDIIFIISIITWYVLVFSTLGKLPITGDRTFMNDYEILRPIYFTLNTILHFMSIFYGTQYFGKKVKGSAFKFIISLLTVLFTANRFPFIDVLYSVFLFYIYTKYNDFKIRNFKIVKGIVILFFLGIILIFIRSNDLHLEVEETLSKTISNKIVYDNTFSDIRDGAFVLYGFKNKFDSLLYGKNYIADLISFIPSSKSPYRQMWSYGSFSTNTLFGWKEHYGLRGGWFLQPYINFGYVGVVFSALVGAYILAGLEVLFYSEMIERRNINMMPYIQIISKLFATIMSCIYISSGFHNFYVYLIILSFIIYFSAAIRKKFIIYK